MRERPLLNLRKLCATGAGGVVKGSSAERGRLAREHNYFSDEFNSKTAEIKPPLPDFVAQKLPSLAGHHPVTLYEKQIVGNYACEPQIKCSLFPPASSRSPARSARMRGHVSSASRASVLPPLVPFRVTLRIGVQPAKAGMRNRAEAKPTRWTQAFFLQMPRDTLHIRPDDFF